jgi:uncharacterized protein (TIGR00725 family)
LFQFAMGSGFALKKTLTKIIDFKTIMNITVFGGSQPREGSLAYTTAQELGRQLAQRGHTVLTGGYMGTMEAVSRGAAEAGGHVIGVTCQDIERWRGTGANNWVTEEWKKDDLIQRLRALIESCDAALALPGGPGTLTEISLMWNLMIIGSLSRKRLVLIGDGWKEVFDHIYLAMGDLSPQNQRDLLIFSPDIKSALEIIGG